MAAANPITVYRYRPTYGCGPESTLAFGKPSVRGGGADGREAEVRRNSWDGRKSAINSQRTRIANGPPGRLKPVDRGLEAILPPGSVIGISTGPTLANLRTS